MRNYGATESANNAESPQGPCLAVVDRAHGTVGDFPDTLATFRVPTAIFPATSEFALPAVLQNHEISDKQVPFQKFTFKPLGSFHLRRESGETGPHVSC
jgi:hypothetical protein